MVWRIQISDPWFHAGVSDIPLIHNNRIYVAESFHVVCLDLFTGDEIWRRTENGAFFTGGILMAEGKLFAMCENLTLYTINPEDGNLIHAEGNNGSGTRMHYHKGRIYYVGQGDGLLHCIDASTGKHLWTMEGPEYQKDDDLFFDNAGLAIDPETDMLYITDYRYAYGYKILE
ncbi:MAG: PQQ-binding-like beta-propeller repeat protein [Saprospiraceae bacterium]|nr:PQQ-binding-like beta-propeller repeat protein [Saprospiraceae bacterium]